MYYFWVSLLFKFSRRSKLKMNSVGVCLEGVNMSQMAANTIVEATVPAPAVKVTKQSLILLCKERGLTGYSSKSIDELQALLGAGGSHNKSPLRYPGGKTRAVKILEKILLENFGSCKTVLSPFFGGGSFELYLYDKGYKVYGNDLFTPLYTFWTVASTAPSALVSSVRSKMPVTKEAFTALREAIKTMKDPMDVATAYYIINRTSFSGATFCGGFSAQAATGRLNEASLKTLGSLKIDGLEFSNLGFAEFLDYHLTGSASAAVIYADPPYYISSYIYGRDGDLHEGFNHVAFATYIKGLSCNWMLSYNDCPYIRDLYKGHTILPVSWSYGMNTSKESSEIVILSLR
jgi:DNA adenine methylase